MGMLSDLQHGTRPAGPDHIPAAQAPGDGEIEIQGSLNPHKLEIWELPGKAGGHSQIMPRLYKREYANLRQIITKRFNSKNF